MAEDYIEEIGFDDDSVEVYEAEFYKGRKGYRDRIGFPLVLSRSDGQKVPMTIKARVHYDENTGTFLCQSSQDNKAVCCKNLGDSNLRFGTIIVHYNTEKDGKIKKPFDYSLKLWYFSDKKFDKLRSLNREFSLGDRDILVKCDNEEFQHLDFMPTKESILSAKEELKNKVLEQAEKLKKDLKKRIAKTLSLEEIREKLGLESAGGGAVIDESDIGDYSDVLDDIE